MGGIGLAAGFAAFKGIKEKFSDMKTKSNHEKNRSYLDSLEQQVAGATVA
jgi:predicted ABC-type exoprotein transport system permease subunit